MRNGLIVLALFATALAANLWWLAASSNRAIPLVVLAVVAGIGSTTTGIAFASQARPAKPEPPGLLAT
jgi:hypothetical protein